jgi:predicted Na+-dependent transporter
MQALLKLTNFVSKTFALWAIVFALLAFLFPEQFKIFAPASISNHWLANT